MRRARERVRQAMDTPAIDIKALPDHLLIEALARAFRQVRPAALSLVMMEVVERLNQRLPDDDKRHLRWELTE